MNAHELNQRLTDQIERVLEHLFPLGKKVRTEFCVGGIGGAKGDSLKIHLGGNKRGYWCDFATNERGRSLLGLWAETCGGDYAKACREAKSWLGISDDFERRFYRRAASDEPKKIPEKVDRSRIRGMVAAGFVENYLVNERHLDPNVLTAYRIAESADGACVVFPFFGTTVSEEGEAEVATEAYMAKFMKVARADGKKEIWTQPGGVVDSLFGKQAQKAMHSGVPKGVLVITEGEIDALSAVCYGYFAVSVPRGAKSATADGKSANDQWIDADYAWLATFERIYLWLDADEPGKKAARDIAIRLGLARCWIVTTPDGRKDANECLCAGLPKERIDQAFAEAETMDPANLVWAGEYVEKVWRRLFPPGGVEPGVELPWPFPWRHRPGEVSVWTGFGGHGKTVLLTQIMVHHAAVGERICIASMEVEPDKTLETVWCQANGGRFPFTPAEVEGMSVEEVERFARGRFEARYKWVEERFLIYVPEVDEAGVGRTSWKTMMDCFNYARQRYGCTQFVIDSLMMCVGRSETEYREVELFVNALTNFAKRNQVHVHLVAHSRKKDDEAKPPGKQDVAGPKETSDMAHNVVVVHRNVGKAKGIESRNKELAELERQTPSRPEEIEERDAEIKKIRGELAVWAMYHDGEMHLLKQRNGDGETGSKYFYFIPPARQFVTGCPKAATTFPDSKPVQYLSWIDVETGEQGQNQETYGEKENQD